MTNIIETIKAAMESDSIARKNLALFEAMKNIERLHRSNGELKASFRVNMLRRAMPGEDIDTEIDRVLGAIDDRK